MKKGNCVRFLSFFCLSLFLVPSVVFSQTGKVSAKQFYDRGIEKINRMDFYGAGEDLQQAVQINSSYADAWFALARVYYELEDFELALSYIENTLKLSKNRREVLNLKGMCLVSLGELEQAEEIFNQIILEYPNDVDARFGLAEIQLFNGSYNAAQNYYLEALKRQGGNRKALLSLAVLSLETGKTSLARKYIQNALEYHASDGEVYYFSAYLEAKDGNLSAAEKRARTAVQLEPDKEEYYMLLSSILYAQKKYDEVLDICDYLISRSRNSVHPWYLKGLTLCRQEEYSQAVDVWQTALTVSPYDEILRSALELLVTEFLPLENDRRKELALYHVNKGTGFSRLFKAEEARYEYQRALRINPYSEEARNAFAEILLKTGKNELYVQQLKFIKSNFKEEEGQLSEQTKLYRQKIEDTVESFESLLRNSLNAKWKVDPFYLDKVRWNIGIYYKKSSIQLLHSDCEDIAAKMLNESFSSVSSCSVTFDEGEIRQFSDAFSLARRKNQDYFVILTFDESEREVSLDFSVYNGRNGVKILDSSFFRTGNDRFASVIRTFRRKILEILPVRGKIIDRRNNTVLIDLGKSDGIVEGTEFNLVKSGKIRTKDSETGVVFDQKDFLGQITVTKAGEEICEGELIQNSFYDKVNIGDEVLIKSVPESSFSENQIADTNPRANTDGIPFEKRPLTPQELDLVKTPSFIDLIRKIY